MHPLIGIDAAVCLWAVVGAGEFVLVVLPDISAHSLSVGIAFVFWVDVALMFGSVYLATAFGCFTGTRFTIKYALLQAWFGREYLEQWKTAELNRLDEQLQRGRGWLVLPRWVPLLTCQEQGHVAEQQLV